MTNSSSTVDRPLPNVLLEDVFCEWKYDAAKWLKSVVKGISEDSREVAEGYIFVARDGEFHKGSDYIEKAIEQGAIGVLAEKVSSITVDENSYKVPVFYIENLSMNAGKIAAKAFGNVVERLNVIGVTGTNGKTSCAHYIAQSLNFLGRSTYMIGTLGTGHPDNLVEASRTTPDACRLHSLFAEYYQKGVSNVVMEVSSHALEQGRVEGVPFYIAAYTNLSRDHLDYHGSMQAYASAKKRLFTEFSAQHRILNFDDEYNRDLYKELTEDNVVKGAITLYSDNIENIAKVDISAKSIEPHKGLVFTAVLNPLGQETPQEYLIDTSLIGIFNIANLLLVNTVLLKMECTVLQIQQSMKSLNPVPGRMQSVRMQDGATEKSMIQALCVVDYAHTPDALAKALQASRVHCKKKLIVVFGCGGDRDTGKRAEMAKIAEQFADVIIVTSDNPRTESPKDIITMIEQGFGAGTNFLSIEERQGAITKAIEIASEQDVVLIAGKGHESYQEIMGIKYNFSDVDIVRGALSELGNRFNNTKGKL